MGFSFDRISNFFVLVVVVVLLVLDVLHERCFSKLRASRALQLFRRCCCDPRKYYMSATLESRG